MTAYKWSTISSQVAFDPSLDTLLFDNASISAADLVIGGLDTGGPVTISYGEKTISLSYLSFKAITSSRVTFANGSQLIIGDDSIGVSGDEGNNDLYGSSNADLFIALGGNDIMHGAGGSDKYLGGAGDDTMYGSSANETFDGGDGVDQVDYFYTYANDSVLINYGQGRYKFITPTQGTDTLYNVEKLWLAGSTVVLANQTYAPTTGVVATAYASMDMRSTLFVAGSPTSLSSPVSQITLFNNQSKSNLAEKLTGLFDWYAYSSAIPFRHVSGAIDKISIEDSGVVLREITGVKIDIYDYQYITKNFTIQSTDMDAWIFSRDDTINGSTQNDYLMGYGGNDTLNGGAGLDTAIYLGAHSDYVIRAVGGGSFTIRDTVNLRDGTDTLTNIERLSFSDGAYALASDGTLSYLSLARSDVNNDGHSDILLQNTNGACYVWQIGDNGLTIKANGFIGGDGGPGAKWQVKATGDFDGDGRSDLLLQYKDTGAVYVWEMNGQSIKAGGFVGGFDGPGAKWQVKATGDFDGDGKSDILLQYADTGAVYVWRMGDNGLTIKGGGFIGGDNGPGAKWQVKATGDFDGDGRSDILLQYADTGAVYVWEMGDNGQTIKAGGFVGGFDGPGAKWQVKATGDFDGDGKSDILLQYADTGAVYIWEMDGLNIKAGGFVGGYDSPGAKWQVKGAGDFDGDGKSDILLQYADTGACYIWEMGDTGLTIKSGGFVGGFNGPGADWHATV